MVWLWWKRNQNYIQKSDENGNNLNHISVISENQTNELFYKLFVNSVIEDISCNEELTYEYLKENHPNFIRKLRFNLVEKLFAHHALIDIYNKLENEKHIIVNGWFSKRALNDGILRLCSNHAITEKIRNGRTKVQILLQPFMEVQALCTVTRYGNDYIELQERGSTLRIEDGAKYTAQMYPNFEQNKYALSGIRGISSDERMLEKLFALDEMDIIEGPSIRELSYSNYIFTISSLAHSYDKTLICASSYEYVKEITLALRKAIPAAFQYGQAARIDTNHKYNPSSMLSRSTVELSKIGNSKLKSFKLVICTFGLAPKLADHGLSNQHFDNIFIHNSQSVSEMDAWMVLGKLANMNTKIFICGNFDGKEVKVDAEILHYDEIGYRISIFERLYCLSSYSICEHGDNITVIEL